MIAIEKNLEQLAAQYGVCDKDLVDHFSIKVKLGRNYYDPIPKEETVVYGSHPDPSTIFSELKTSKQNLVLAPGAQVIACSKDSYHMPLDYFGLVQTKGTLARLFVSTTCNDGQIEPGFSGFITLEIVNHSPWTIELPAGSEVAQLYIVKCSSKASQPYNGRYVEHSKKGPTLAIFS